MAAGTTIADAPPAPVVDPPSVPPPLRPLSHELPVIGGDARQQRQLTATSGTWTGATDGFSYEWRRCDKAGEACEDIAGAINVTYLPGVDLGSTLRVAVTATNGGELALSAAVGTWDPMCKGYSDSSAGDFKMEVETTGELSCYFKGSSGVGRVNSGRDLADNQWHTVTCSRRCGSILISVDGKTSSESASIGSIPTATRSSSRDARRTWSSSRH